MGASFVIWAFVFNSLPGPGSVCKNTIMIHLPALYTKEMSLCPYLAFFFFFFFFFFFQKALKNGSHDFNPEVTEK